MAAEPAAGGDGAKPGAGPPANEKITRGMFVDHGKAVRVYDNRKIFADLEREAADDGVTFEEVMKEKGHQTISALYRSCPQHKLTCWPSDLAELGAGVVLYFHFLVFCGLVLFVGFLIQIPAIKEYADAGKLDAWNYDPKGFLSSEISACDCVGKNGGFLGFTTSGQTSQNDYGKSCGTWDLDWCNSNVVADEGRWCCRSWCYASADCASTHDGESASLSNRFSDDNELVRSYLACSQPADSQCPAGMLDFDVAFPFDTFKNDDVVSETWYSKFGPGAFGPWGGSSDLIPLLYMLFLGFYCFAVVVEHQWQYQVNNEVDRRTTQPNDFAILVSGLPITANDEQGIKEWFAEHAVAGKNNTDIVKVVIGWECEEYRECQRKKKDLSVRYMKAYFAKSLPSCMQWMVSTESMEDIEQQLVKVSKEFRELALHGTERLVTSGAVVVVFRKQTDHRNCLERWATWTARYFYKDSTGRCGLPGQPLPTYGKMQRRIRVQRAPNPSNINWENLSVSQNKRNRKLMETNLMMGAVLLVSFGLVFAFNHLEGMESGNSFVAVLPAFGVSLCNMGVTYAAKTFGAKEHWNTLAGQTASVSMKLATGYVVNTALVGLAANFWPKMWYLDSGLSSMMITLMGLTGVIQPLFFLMDFKYSFIARFSRQKLTDQKIDEWNDVLAKRIPADSPPEQKEDLVKRTMGVRKEVDRMKKAFEPSQLDMTKRYAYAIRTLLVCMFYAPLMPFITLLGVVGLATQYAVDKYMILRWVKRPAEPITREQAILSLMFVRYTGALFLPVGTIVFLHASWQDDSTLLWYFAVSLGGAVGFCVFPLSFWRTALGLRCLCFLGNKAVQVKPEPEDFSEDYYEIQRTWKEDELFYHKSHFLYKMVPPKHNPKYLEVGTKATDAKDLKDSYKRAADHAADDKLEHGKSAKLLGVGKVDGGPADEGPKDEEPADEEPADEEPADEEPADEEPADEVPADEGPADEEPKDEEPKHEEPKDGEPAAEGDDAEPARRHRGKGGGKGRGRKKVVWEFEVRKGFKGFDSDCQNYIERKYQAYRHGTGKSRIIVNTQGHSLSVDFEKMTQSSLEGSRERRIQRLEL